MFRKKKKPLFYVGAKKSLANLKRNLGVLIDLANTELLKELSDEETESLGRFLRSEDTVEQLAWACKWSLGCTIRIIHGDPRTDVESFLVEDVIETGVVAGFSKDKTTTMRFFVDKHGQKFYSEPDDIIEMVSFPR